MKKLIDLKKECIYISTEEELYILKCIIKKEYSNLINQINYFYKTIINIGILNYKPILYFYIDDADKLTYYSSDWINYYNYIKNKIDKNYKTHSIQTVILKRKIENIYEIYNN